MPNHSKREQETLSGDLLALVEQGRQPALGGLDDSALLALITRLDEARAQAETAEDPDSARFLRAATRRAQGERRTRGLRSPLQAGSAGPAVPAKPARAAQAAKRKGATIARKPAGRKPAEARKTDLRTEPHRMPKRRATPPEATATDLPPDSPARTSRMTDSTLELDQPVDQAETKVKAPRAAKAPATAADKEATKAARKAQKQQAAAAQKDAEKQAKLADKEAARAERKAARKAEKQMQKDAEKEVRRAERKAAAAATKAKDAASAKAEKQKGKKDGAGKAKPGKDKDRKSKADQQDS